MGETLSIERLQPLDTTIDEIAEKMIAQEGRRIIMVGAHPDDQLFWAGTVYDLLEKAGSDIPDTVTVTDVTLTHGENGEDLTPNGDDLGPKRLQENISGLQSLLGNKYSDLLEMVTGMNAPDGSVDEHQTTLLEWLNTHPAFSDDQPALIVTFDELGGDGHEDHKAARRIAEHLASERGWPVMSFSLEPNGHQAHVLSQEASEHVTELVSIHKSQWAEDGPPDTHSHLTHTNHWQIEVPAS